MKNIKPIECRKCHKKWWVTIEENNELQNADFTCINMINLNCISDNKINKLLSSFNISLTREEIENIYFDAVLNKYHLESEYKMPYIEDIDEKVYSNKDYEESKKITAKHIELYNVIISKIEKLIPGLIKLKEQRLNEYIKLDKEIFN